MRLLLASLVIGLAGCATASNEPPRPLVQNDAKCTASARQLKSYELAGSERYKSYDLVESMSETSMLIFAPSAAERAVAVEWGRREIETLIADKSEEGAKADLIAILSNCPVMKALEKRNERAP